MYNIHDYMKYIIERGVSRVMTLEGMLTVFTGTKDVNLSNATHKSLYKINKEPFYIGTSFNQINTNLNSRFALISAPGATGKSAFGKFLAYKVNGLYWDLADISIGDGTFQGTLSRAIGISNLSQYASDLRHGICTLVIDAFDEAEVVSGRKNVETFLREANEFLDDAASPSVVLLSRTETAQNIAAFFKDNSIPYTHFEIGYFPEQKAKDFITKAIEINRSVTTAMTSCIDQYFVSIRQLIKDRNVQDRFLGYAPVLEAIAKHIAETSNTAKLLSELSEDCNEVHLMNGVMDSLIQREQEKFVSAFKNSLGKDKDRITDWNKIYCKEEQLIRVLNYIVLEEINIRDYEITAIPAYLEDEYEEKLKIFLVQHPFIQRSFQGAFDTAILDYAGPAFRDYSLANVIMHPEYEENADLYYQREATTSHFPSQLFWAHYNDLSNGEISSKHFPYVYEAYKAKIDIKCQTFVSVNEDEDGVFATFGITKGDELIDAETIAIKMVNNALYLHNISNVSVNIKGDIIIGNADYACISDSSINCNALIIKAHALTVNAFSPSITSICCERGIETCYENSLTVITNCSGVIRVDVPNIREIPKLARYKFKLSDSSSPDIYYFIHNLRKIFSSFRTHKKDMPARDAEKIDFVVIADNPFRKEIFEYLLHSDIIFREKHLYKIRLSNMSEHGISWGALMASNTDQLDTCYRRFCDWAKK